MKKFILSLGLFCLGFGISNAQSQSPGSWKAQDKIQKADKLADSPEGSDNYNQALSLYAEAEAIIANDIEAAKTKGDSEKLTLLYIQNANVQGKLLNPDLKKASNGFPFDTLMFCKRIDNIVNSYNTSAVYNKTPNAKGKIKTNAVMGVYAKQGILNNLTLYYNCGAFMDAMGRKQESVDYFQKYVDLPKTSPVFTESEADSIYKSPNNAKIYNMARFNLALQNFYLKNWDKAVENATEALKDTTNMHDLYLIKINALGEMKDSVAWRNTLVEAAQRTGSQNFLQNLMYYYMQNGKIEEATELVNKLVSESPGSKMAWFMKGAIELNIKKDYQGSRESFKKALEIDPDFADALYNMGTAYINDIYDQRTSGKFKYIGTNRVITGKQSDGSYQREKAIYDKELAFVKSYYENAKPYLERFRELKPEDVRRWASPLQMVYAGLGQTEKAKEMDAYLDAANANR